MATYIASGDPVMAVPPELRPSVDHLVTEDNTPVDNVFSEKQQRLLTESLHTSWPGPGEGRPFVAMANVGLFYGIHLPAVVPDVLLSLDVALPRDVWPKSARSYFNWEYGKPPDVVIEVVSNREGGEDAEKLALFAQIPIRYYAIFDPQRLLGNEMLRAYRLQVYSFQRMTEPVWFPEVGLGLRLWDGRYEDLDATWLRWVDAQGVPVPTGKEGMSAARQGEEAERQRADRLAEQLRQLGVEPHGA